ncbi:MAG: hypothetical protein ABFS46_22330, partial [Myxococcota bacterium]
VEVSDGLLRLSTEHFEFRDPSQVYLNFELEGRPYFFAAPILSDPGADSLEIGWPAVVYEAERRDRGRRPPGDEAGDPETVALRGAREQVAEARVVDVSPGGLGVEAPAEPVLHPGARVEVDPLGGDPRGWLSYGRVRSRRPAPDANGWVRLGLELSSDPWPSLLPVERRSKILEGSQRHGSSRVPALDAASAVAGSVAPRPRVVRYPNPQGEQICGIVDVWGDPRGAAAVIIPSAWGRTKETLLPLALTIGATFHAAGEPVTVVRFDGIRRRGESHRDPGCQGPEDENLRFTFSQGARDIHATLDYLERSPEFQPSTCVLVTFSVASIEGRRALASDQTGRLGGWVSVVGSADAQSLTRVISGGVDFFGGIERGMRFGMQEIQGLLVDMDHAGRDAVSQGLAFLCDSRHDFASIRAPITWLHGRHDAWMDLGRIRDALSFGDTSQRRLIEIPTGHQLRTSREALETFQLIASEAGRISLGNPLPPVPPDLGALDRRRKTEMERLEATRADLRGFWKDYVVGREGGDGMELVTNARPYEALMERQIDDLSLEAGDRVLDLGSGAGPFPLQLARSEPPGQLRIVEMDVVREALTRTRVRMAGRTDESSGLDVQFAQADLDGVRGRGSIP